MKKTPFILLIVSLMAVSYVWAAASLSLVTTTWTASTINNISLGDGMNLTYVTVYASSSSTANSSTSLVANISNSTATDFNAGYANFTLGSDIVLEDSNDYSITATTTGNGGQDGKTLSATTATVDRTTPAAPTTSHTSGTTFDDVATTTITYTVIGENTTGCRISFGRGEVFTGSNTYAMTHSGNSCTYTVSDTTIPDGSYDVYVQASDGTDTATSDKIDFRIDVVADNAGAGVNLEAVGKQVASEKISQQNVFFLIVAVLAIWLLFFKKK